MQRFRCYDKIARTRKSLLVLILALCLVVIVIVVVMEELIGLFGAWMGPG